MKTAPRTLGTALLLVALLVSPVRAAPPSPGPVFADRSVWTPLEWALGNQRRMLQVATVGMCLALYIIWWRK